MDRRDFIKYGTVLAGVGGVCLLCKNGSVIFKENTADIKYPQMDTRPCLRPFVNLVLHNEGQVSPCCREFLKCDAGNIEKQNLDEIWNGEIYTDLRQRILKGDYSMCNRDICCMYMPGSVDEIPSDYKKGPKVFTISYDFECNYRCITCRDTIITNTPQEMALYENVYSPKIKKIIKNVEVINLLGSGDPLFSRYSRHFMSEIVKEKPDIKFLLCTNGFLLDEKNLTDIGIQNNILGILISLNAVNRETYKKILRTDAFDRVMKNIELMAEWKKQGRIEWIRINFVTHLMNYKEMPDFVKLAQKLDITALFTVYRPWETAEYHKRYKEVAVFEPNNKHYKELAEILHNPVFKDEKHCMLEPRLLSIVNS